MNIKKYFENLQLLQDTQTNITTLEDTNYSMIHSQNYNDKEYKENKNNIQRLVTIKEITLNNLLYIQQELLFKLLLIYKKDYINKRIGEKTKEKIQNEFNNYILTNYDIECYSYIRNKLDYNDNEVITISLYFKDLYYQYELKQEEIRYNKNNEEFNYYYYSKVNYTPIENIESKANELVNYYNNTMEKIRELKKQIENIRNENNEKNKCCLKSTYIDYKEI